MKTIGSLLEGHPFFAGMEPETLDFIGGCGKNVVFEEGKFLGRMGKPAHSFYVIRHGSVADELNAAGGALQIGTVGPGGVVGFSWLFPPFSWQFDVRAAELTRAIEFDGDCLRAKCDKDSDIGYDMMQRFARLMSERMAQMRLQLLDMFAS